MTDTDTITKPEQVKEICHDVFKEMVFEYEANKIELEQIKNGTRILLPVNQEHAKMMLIVAMNYLGIKPGETFTYEQNEQNQSQLGTIPQQGPRSSD